MMFTILAHDNQSTLSSHRSQTKFWGEAKKM